MIVLQHFNDFAEAQDVRRHLEDYGLHPVVVEDLVTPDTSVVAKASVRQGAEVQVPEDEATAAIRLVDDLEALEPDELVSGS